MGWGMGDNLFCEDDNDRLPQHERDGFSCLIINDTNGIGKILNYNGLRQMGSISL